MPGTFGYRPLSMCGSTSAGKVSVPRGPDHSHPYTQRTLSTAPFSAVRLLLLLFVALLLPLPPLFAAVLPRLAPGVSSPSPASEFPPIRQRELSVAPAFDHECVVVPAAGALHGGWLPRGLAF